MTKGCACPPGSARASTLLLEDPVFLEAEWHHPTPPSCDSARPTLRLPPIWPLSLSLSLPLSVCLSTTADWDHAADECVFQCHPSPARERRRCEHHHKRRHRGGIPSHGLHPAGAALAPRLKWTHTGRPNQPPSTPTVLLHAAPWGPGPVLGTPRLLHWERHGSQNKENAVSTPHPWK